MSATVPLFRWRTLPPGFVAQPTLGGEHNGTRWELERVYDPRGKLDRGRTYWEVYDSLAADPAPRSVAYADVKAMVPFVEFSRTTTPLAEIEQWLATETEVGSGA